ncbi:MAG: hypothetical protein E7611_00825 [Ruminococcaceae bacterium]|nr:hypothetical protein [Oscillospiraceae bacterium]
MKLLFKQRFTFGLDTYDIYNEMDETVFTVKSRFALGRKLEIYDRGGNLVGTLIGKVFTFLPTFEMYVGDSLVGTIQKQMTFFKPKFILDCNGWEVNGSFWEWDYSIVDSTGKAVATLTQEFDWTDTYILDIVDDADALAVLMIVIAIDAEKDSRG